MRTALPRREEDDVLLEENIRCCLILHYKHRNKVKDQSKRRIDREGSDILGKQQERMHEGIYQEEKGSCE